MSFDPALARTPAVQTKLPAVGTTIFTVMSALAAEKGAVNLGQGFPDFDCDPRLVRAVAGAMAQGLNQYPPMAGVAPLRAAVAAKIETMYGRAYDPNSEITITAGATQAIITAILAVVRPGDEVIVLDPCYDSYVPNIDLAGGTAVRVPLTPGSFRPDFGKIAAAITGRTRIDHAFAQKKLSPRIALEAIDSDVIKTYVRLGLGIGIVAEMSVRDEASNGHGELAVRPLGTLFGQNVARVAFKRGAYLRNFVYAFAETTSERLTRALVMRAMTGEGDDYQL